MHGRGASGRRSAAVRALRALLTAAATRAAPAATLLLPAMAHAGTRSSASGATAPEPPIAATRGIHALEARAYAGRPAPRVRGGAGPAAPLGPRIESPLKQVHGFHPYWMGTSYTQYDWTLLSSVSFFAVDLSATGA